MPDDTDNWQDQEAQQNLQLQPQPSSSWGILNAPYGQIASSVGNAASNAMTGLKNWWNSDSRWPSVSDVAQGAGKVAAGAVEHAVDPIKNYVDAATGQPGTDIGRESFNMMTALAGGGMPAAEKGAAGAFGGRLAATADLKALQSAQQMEQGGIHAHEIYTSTGWYKDPWDNQWKFVIPDDRSRLNYLAGSPKGTLDPNVVRGPATEMMRHQRLEKAYPELRNVPFESRWDPNTLGKGQGNYYPPSPQHPLGHIDISSPDIESGREIGLHELQHVIQSIEGFHPGANPERFINFLKSDPQGYQQAFGKVGPREVYKRIAGEVEARKVQAGMNMTPTEWLYNHPLLERDVPSNQVLSFLTKNYPQNKYPQIDPMTLLRLRGSPPP